MRWLHLYIGTTKYQLLLSLIHTSNHILWFSTSLCLFFWFLIFPLIKMMVAFSSLMSCLIFERFSQRTGLCCMSALLVSAILCVLHERLVSICVCFRFYFILCLFCTSSDWCLQVLCWILYASWLVAEFIMISGSAWCSSWFFL